MFVMLINVVRVWVGMCMMSVVIVRGLLVENGFVKKVMCCKFVFVWLLKGSGYKNGKQFKNGGAKKVKRPTFLGRSNNRAYT